jgi:hypothetical protein
VGNVCVAGIITAGYASEVGTAFYAGKLNRNLIPCSNSIVDHAWDYSISVASDYNVPEPSIFGVMTLTTSLTFK